jgi:hypothetical protein
METNDTTTSGPIDAHGVRGMNSKAWRKTFKSLAAMEKWLEKAGGDVELQGWRPLES